MNFTPKAFYFSRV